MTTVALMIILLGAGSIAVNLMRLFDHMEHPQNKRRTRTA